jgi:hypothetical protein
MGSNEPSTRICRLSRMVPSCPSALFLVGGFSVANHQISQQYAHRLQSHFLTTKGAHWLLAAYPLVMHAWKMSQHEQLTRLDLHENTPESICAGVAKLFRVSETEVALLELSGSMLNFVYPVALRTAGAIPLSSSAVAARTARTKQSELFNGFAQVTHFSVFELVKLGDSGLDDQVIQKLMSAPVLSKTGEVIGVIQISRKAPRLAAAGPDFTAEDLRKLESSARTVAKLMAKGRSFAAQATSG